MRTNKLHYALVLFLAGTLVACDKLCSTTVNEVVSVDNRTGRDLDLQFCKGKFGNKQDVEVSSDQIGDLRLGEVSQPYVVGGMNAKCDRSGGESSGIGLALTSESFNLVKLCYVNEMGSDVIVIEKWQACPVNTEEQISPVDKCSEENN